MGPLLTVTGPGSASAVEAERSHSLVWIDASGALVVRLIRGRARLDRVVSDVPPHRRSTGHVRHDPRVRHGGGGRPQTAGEPQRLEHLGRFVEAVAARVPPTDDVLVVGPGPVPGRLARRLGALDRRHGRTRAIVREPSAPATDRELVARLRAFAGTPARRRTVGTGGRLEPDPEGPSGRG